MNGPDGRHSPGDQPAPIGRLVQAELLAAAFRMIPAHLYMVPLGGLLLCVLVAPFTSRAAVLAWFVGLNGVAFFRYLLTRAYRRARPGVDRTEWWTRWFVVGAFGQGLMWSMAGSVLFPPIGTPEHVVVAICLVGIVSVALVGLGHLMASYIVFALAVLLPFAATLLTSGTRGDQILGVAALLFAAFVTTAARNVHRHFAEWQRLRLEMAQLAAEREAANQAKSQFLATMSHEIRTPINGVLGLAELLRREDLPAAQRVRYVDQLARSGQSLLAIVNDILDFSKIESGHLELEATDFDVQATVTDTLESLRQAAEARRLSLSLDLGPEVPAHACGDPGRLQQVLANLVGNAIKFTERGEVAVRGWVPAATGAGPPRPDDATLVRFSVTDTGIGIPRDQLERIFDAFAQADSSHSRRYGGTGLGLAIVRRLVHLMGGEIRADSEPGRGSTFSFTVPLRPARGPVTTSTEAARHGTSRALRGHVLLAEDNEVNREIAEAMLRAMGIRVSAAADGHEALERMRATRFDAVLMDCQMPALDGFEATRRIRAAERASEDHRHVPIVALTAYALSGDRERCLEAGMDDYLAKPFTQSALREMLGRWLPSVTGGAPDAGGGGEARGDDTGGMGDLDGNVLAGLRQIDGGAGGVERRVITLYLDTSPKDVEALRAAVAAVDHGAAASRAHVLKSASANVGAVRLSAGFRSIEEAARAQDAGALAARFAAVDRGYAAACRALRERAGAG